MGLLALRKCHIVPLGQGPLPFNHKSASLRQPHCLSSPNLQRLRRLLVCAYTASYQQGNIRTWCPTDLWGPSMQMTLLKEACNACLVYKC